MEQKLLIIGLGNPGKEYEKTRHNVGWMFLDYLKSIPDAKFEEWKEKKKLNALISKGAFSVERLALSVRNNQENIILAKPTTYMNNSGITVKKLLTQYPIPYTLYPERLIIVHDDIDIPFGEYRIQTNRGSAGHHGVESIVEHLGTRNFKRMRIGIVSEIRKKAGDYVLKKFSSRELKNLQEVFSTIANQFFP